MCGVMGWDGVHRGEGKGNLMKRKLSFIQKEEDR